MNISSEKNKEIFTPLDIIWFKSVTNPNEGESYLDLTDNIFFLHFPSNQKGNVSKPKVDEIILLYQKVNGIQAFTHLVTPIDDELIDENSNSNYRYARRVKVIAKTDKNNYIPVSNTKMDDVYKAGISNGNACKLNNVSSIKNIEEIQLDIWKNFIGHFVDEYKESEKITSNIINDLDLMDQNFQATEGWLRLVTHLIKERNRSLINKKKENAIINNLLKCEICGFSFSKTYDVEFIECHHLNPIGQGGVRKTELNDLALVCANCHRMLHKKIDGQYFSKDQLKERINQLNSPLGNGV